MMQWLHVSDFGQKQKYQFRKSTSQGHILVAAEKREIKPSVTMASHHN